MNYDDLKKDLEIIKGAVKNLEGRIEEVKPEEPDEDLYVLFLRSIGGELELLYKESKDTYYQIGRIDHDGECYILSAHTQINCYNLWVEKGMKVNSSSITWKGSEYNIGPDYALTNIDLKISIYDLEYCIPYSDAQMIILKDFQTTIHQYYIRG